MKKISTVRINGNTIFKGHKLTIGVDLGDRWSCYCVLDEAGEILLEQKVATTPEAMKQDLAESDLMRDRRLVFRAGGREILRGLRTHVVFRSRLQVPLRRRMF